MLFIVPKLDANSFTFLPVIIILVSPPKCVNLTDVLLLTSVSTSWTYRRNNNGPRTDPSRTHYWIILFNEFHQLLYRDSPYLPGAFCTFSTNQTIGTQFLWYRTHVIFVAKYCGSPSKKLLTSLKIGQHMLLYHLVFYRYPPRNGLTLYWRLCLMTFY